MGPEAKLWKALRPLLEEAGCFCTRIENRHGGGLPDVDVSSPVGAFKIELKIIEKFSVRITDIQIAYNTVLTHKHGLSFILAKDPGRSVGYSNTPIFEDQEPGTESRGLGYDDTPVGSGRGPRTKGRGQSGLGPRSGRGQSGRVGPQYYLWHGRDAVAVGRSGTRAEALASGSGLQDMVAVMLAVCREHHRALLERAPGA